MNFFVILQQTCTRMQRQYKGYLLHGMWRLGFKHWGRHAPFYRLPDELMAWQQHTLKQRGVAALTIQDITSIRQLLARAQERSSANLPPALLDQWFFLALGAMQQPTPAASQRAWQLFDQSVHAQLAPARFYMPWSFGLLLSLCVIWMAVVPIRHAPAPAVSTPFDMDPYASAGSADPVTLSLLHLVYQKMKNGSCQLPQAAMLPEPQRHAFVLFVTEGKVEPEQVEPLRQALGYVSCLYPQELMQPQVNRLPKE